MSKKNTAKPRTAPQVKDLFKAYGITITAFCDQHKLSRMAVADLLRGEGKATRGESHRAAVLLGMKADPKTKSILHPFEKMEQAA